MTLFHRGRLIDRKFQHVFFVPPCQLMINLEPVKGTPDEYIVFEREEILSIFNSILELMT